MKIKMYEVVKQHKYIVLATLFFLIVVFPMFISGYMFDDAINSYTLGGMIESNLTLTQHTLKYMSSWIHNGRFFPLAFYGYGLFVLIQNLVAYKIFLFLLNLIDISLFLYLIFLLTKNKVMVNLSYLTIPLFYSFHIGFDPVLGFGGLLQLVFLYILISLIFLKFYLDSRKFLYLLLSVLFYCFSLATYEITYLFFLFHAVVIWFNYKQQHPPKKNTLLYISPFLGSAVLFAGLSLLLRYIFKVPIIGSNSPYTINIKIAPMLATYAKQLVGTLPLSYRILDPDKLFSPSYSIFIKLILLALPIVFIFLLGLCNGKNSMTRDEKLPLQSTIVLGLLMLILPGVLVSFSAKYQGYMGWGRPYLPVFIQIFGLDLILISSGLYFRHRFAKWLKFLDDGLFPKAIRYLSLALVAILCFFTVSSNYSIVQRSNQFWLYPRKTLEYALDNGLLNGLPSDSVILVDSNNPWDSTAFFLMHSGIKGQKVLSKGNYVSSGSLEPQPFSIYQDSESSNKLPFSTKHVYYLRYDSKQLGTGYVILAPLDDLKINDNRIISAFASVAKIFYWSPDSASTLSQVSGVIEYNDNNVRQFLLKRSELKDSKYGNDFIISRVENLGGMIDLNSVNVNSISSSTRKSEYWNLVPQNQLLFKDHQVPQFHVGFKNGFVKDGAEFSPVELASSFSVEVLVKPYATQVPYAGIIGNHPGEKYYSGFVIQQNSQSANNYQFGFGDGNKWMKETDFKLTPNQWSYVAVIVNQHTQEIVVYVNGTLAGKQVLEGQINNSHQPLFVGNFIGGDRAFNGLIKEVKITNGVLTREEIQINSELVEQNREGL
ncbi:LamG domain-containing protein [Desulfosporosinus metallidurans]|uniref:LamG-like jellyroll fold domain-containing protein n=1 Tax=Desulfosporosinus metallidurans TaxID=1888891 RepID=A0A1Q8QXU3_9FIRM|nr:LamG domain-containing protein [Desulfosporosinus metallidurans]OLN32157.1 hypothetical protein DSOL_2030 [Desulfosporosinus metallidurans]